MKYRLIVTSDSLNVWFSSRVFSITIGMLIFLGLNLIDIAQGATDTPKAPVSPFAGFNLFTKQEKPLSSRNSSTENSCSIGEDGSICIQEPRMGDDVSGAVEAILNLDWDTNSVAHIRDLTSDQKISFKVHSARVLGVKNSPETLRYFIIWGSLTETYVDGTSYDLQFIDKIQGYTKNQYLYNPTGIGNNLALDMFGPGTPFVMCNLYTLIGDMNSCRKKSELFFYNPLDDLATIGTKESVPEFQFIRCCSIQSWNLYWTFAMKSKPSLDQVKQREALFAKIVPDDVLNF